MINAFSLFSGCGGCSLGLKQAGFEVKLAADLDKDACATYALNFGSEGLWRLDLSQIQPEALLERARIESSQLDLIVGGPPCQGFSSAGAKNCTDPRNILLQQFVAIVISLKPTWFIMENVEGLLTSQEGFYLIEAITQFLASGYWVMAKKVYLEAYGLPQKRKRVFIVGNLEKCLFQFPPGLYYHHPQLSLFENHPQRSLLDAIGDLPKPDDSESIFYDKPPQCNYQAQLRQPVDKPLLHHQTKPVNSLNQARINRLAPGATMKDLPPQLQHPSYSRRASRRVRDGTPTEKRGGAPNGLKRLVGDAPSLTITSAAPTEFIHPIEDRLLTLRECARIQSFPDWYNFTGSWSAIATQIGNAMPPLFINLLANHIKSLASWEKRNSDQPGRWLGIDATKSSGKSPKLAKMLGELDEKTHVYVR